MKNHHSYLDLPLNKLNNWALILPRVKFYNFRSKSTVTNIGATAGDEMCNLYLMYYNEDEKHDYIDCGRQDDPTISRAVDARMEAEFAPAAKIKPEPKSIGITTNNKPLLGHRLNLNFKIGKKFLVLVKEDDL